MYADVRRYARIAAQEMDLCHFDRARWRCSIPIKAALSLRPACRARGSPVRWRSRLAADEKQGFSARRRECSAPRATIATGQPAWLLSALCGSLASAIAEGPGALQTQHSRRE